jgi:4-amino-4-deoxy-L-arabinose transferase-like glycosyltransferase
MKSLRKTVLELLEHPRAPHFILLVGLLLRIGLLIFLGNRPFEGDAGSYHEIALQWAAGTPFEPDWPPGVPSLLIIAYKIFGSSPIVARVVMLPVYVAFCAVVTALGKRIGGVRVANFALAVFAVTPIFIWTSVNPLTPLPSAALALGAVLFADRCRTGTHVLRDSLMLGLCLAGLLLTRPSNIAMVGALPVYLLWRRARWQVVAIPVVVVALLTGAWCLKCYRMTGRPVFINNANSQNIFYGNNPYTPLYHTWWYGSHKMPGEMTPEFEGLFKQILKADMKERDRLYVKTATDHIKARPDLFLLRTVNRVRVFFGFDTFTSAQLAKESRLAGTLTLAADAGLYVWLCLLALLFPAVVLSRAKGWEGLMASARAASEGQAGGLEAWRSNLKRRIEMLLLVALLYAFPYFFAFSHPTFHVPMTALVGMIGAFAGVALLETGIVAIWSGLGSWPRRWTVVAVVAFLLIQVEWGVALVHRVV